MKVVHIFTNGEHIIFNVGFSSRERRAEQDEFEFYLYIHICGSISSSKPFLLEGPEFAADEVHALSEEEMAGFL